MSSTNGILEKYQHGYTYEELKTEERNPSVILSSLENIREQDYLVHQENLTLRIVSLKNEGMPLRGISQLLCIPISTVKRCIKSKEKVKW